MAVYPNMLTTQAGYDLISRANTTKKALIITRAALGKGDLGSNNIVSLTDLIDPVMDNLPLTNSIDHQNGHYEVEASIDNSELDTGFWAKEMGIFAKVDGDATDTLYAYTNGGIYVPYVNDKPKPDIQLVQCDFIVGNATNVEATIDVKVYITEGRLQKHNTDPAAHGDKLVNLTTNGNSLRAVKGDGTTIDVTPNWANVAKYVGDGTFKNFANTGATVGDFKKYILSLLDAVPLANSKDGMFIHASIACSINDLITNMGDDSHVLAAGGQIGLYIDTTSITDNKYAHIRLNSYGYQAYELGVNNGVFETPRAVIYAKDGKNTADAWETQSNELVIDGNGSTSTALNVGKTALNYTGTGFDYYFYNGKGSLANLACNSVNANVFYGKATWMYNGLIADVNGGISANTISNVGYTGSTTTNNFAYKYNFIQTFKNATDVAQLCIPISTSYRVSVRGQGNAGSNTLTSTWKELAYVDDLAPYASLSSPALTGIPTAPTADGSNSKAVANVEYVLGQSRASYGETGFRVARDGYTTIWGRTYVGANGNVTVNYPIALWQLFSAYVGQAINSDNGNTDVVKFYSMPTNTSIRILNTADGYGTTVFWEVKGLP